MGFFSNRLGILTLALCGVLAWPAPAQNRAKPAKKTAKKAPAAPKNSGLPLLLGSALGGLVVGGALGWSLKKPRVEVQTNADSALDEALSPLAFVDAGERLTRANAAFARLFGGALESEMALAALLHPDDLIAMRAGLANVFDGDAPRFETEARFFRPGGELLHAHVDVSGIGRKPKSALLSLQDITRRVEAERELRGAQEAIRSLYQVVSGDSTRSLDEKIKSLLAMGCGRFELPIGVLGRFGVDESGGESFETLFVLSPDRRIRPALVLPVGESASVETQLLGLSAPPHVGNWRKHPFVTHNRESAYLGAPVGVEGKLFGMLSFSSLTPRDGGFAPGETELLQLMAQWIGGEIERDRARAALDRQQKQLLAANSKLESLATHDALTEAKNRRAFDEKIAEEWSRATRYGTPLSLVLLDVDKFKKFNDSFGHQAGDEVLKSVSRTVMSLVRGTDFFARYGGEEFALILPNTDIEGAMILAERLRARVEATPWQEHIVTASFGVATIEPKLKRAEELIAASDEALYQSKDRGRNRVTHAREIERVEVPK